MTSSSLPTDFPKEHFLKGVVQILDTIKYKDTNLARHERVDLLRFVYAETSRYFAERKVHEQLNFSMKKLDHGLRTITQLVVDAWVSCSKELLVSLAIYFTFTLIIDDTKESPRSITESFFEDVPVEKKHPILRLADEHMHDLMRHYGPFSSLGIFRSSVDALASQWLEKDNFQGFPDNEEYPEFLRRLNGLGHVVGTTIFPAAEFPEEKYLREIATSMNQLECWMAWSNDVISFYKEFDDPDDTTTLIHNHCATGGMTVNQAFDKVAGDTVRVSKQIMSVFADRDEHVRETMTRFMHGYMTWHLCDKRYRMSEVYKAANGEDAVSDRFRRYFEAAKKAGGVDPQEWATGPTFLERVEQQSQGEKTRKGSLVLRGLAFLGKDWQARNMDVIRSLLAAFVLSILGCAASIAFSW